MMRTAALLAGTALTATLVGAPAASAAPYCGITWGSLAKSSSAMTSGPLTGVRAGQSSCYDRLVLDLGTSPRTGYSVSYVSQITQDGSGDVVPTRGGAKLQVVANSPAYDMWYHPTYDPANPNEVADVNGFRTFRQVVWAGTFEGYSTVGVGVRARLPFRIFTLAGPGSGSRLVVDVAHAW